MIREVKFEEDVRQKQLKGAKTVYEAVSSTMGAKGGLVNIQNRYDENYLSKDGHYTAQTIFLEDPIENMGAQMLKEVALTSSFVGDGTTTSTVLAYHMFEKGLKGLSSGFNAIDIKRGMDKAVQAAIKSLKKNAIVIKDDDYKSIQHVATVSANNNVEIGKTITEAAKGINEEGVIITQDAKGYESSVEITEGLVIEKSYISPYFVTNAERMIVEYDDVCIIVLNETISTLKQILPVLKYIAAQKRPLLIIASDVEQEALAILVKNKMEGGLQVVAIRCPGVHNTQTTWMEDIAASTGATVISGIKGTSAESFVPEMLGSAKKIKIDKDRTTIINADFDKDIFNKRVQSIRNQIMVEKQSNSVSFHKERLAKLTGGIAVIHIGYTTEVELKEKKDLYEDAIAAIKAATSEGVIAGGGSSLVHASKALDKIKGANDDERFGIKVIRDAMLEPLITIMRNAGLTNQNILSQVLASDNVNYGFNLNTNKYCDMIEEGILDTLKVERLALENSCSVASMMLMTKCSISTIQNNNSNNQ